MIDEFRLVSAETPEHMDGIRELFREYQEWLAVDLCFQGFDEELSGLPGSYAKPMGRLFLVFDDASGELAACVGIRPLGPERCEMKRLYVRPAWQGRGLGRALVDLCLHEAAGQGFKAMCLDTLAHLEAARKLYASMGFREIPAYYDNPLDDVVYMEIDLLAHGQRR